jgi:hypothetical protein
LWGTEALPLRREPRELAEIDRRRDPSRRVPAKPDRPDRATRMAMDADFSPRPSASPLPEIGEEAGAGAPRRKPPSSRLPGGAL